MIRSLRIENFALIDALSIDFTSGFTVITGETGSGKSILLNALNLILGDRANFSVIGTRGDKASVEAEVDISGFGLQDFFRQNELDYYDQTIVRREISAQGRSRAFINDTPVQLNVLREFSSNLIQIHSQYSTLELRDRQFQLHVLDVLAGTLIEQRTFAKQLENYRELKATLAARQEELSALMAREDYNTFQLIELQSLRLDEMNYAALEAELKSQEHADDIRQVLSEVNGIFSDEQGVNALLNRARSAALKRKDISPDLGTLAERLSSLLIEARDLSEEAGQMMEKVEVDPRRLNELLNQLDNYHRIARKHNTETQEELQAMLTELSVSAEGMDELRKEIAGLEENLKAEEHLLRAAAASLHLHREKAVPEIEKSLKESLQELKLENTVLEFRLAVADTWNTFGHSQLELFFSPNSGVSPVPVHEAASGGELSRVMLALQGLMSARTRLRTILFDEIDTGVSGEVAQKMGAMLKKMGEGMQVIAITHLPQVAAKGGQHFKVQKTVVDGVSTTSVVELTPDQRVEETARLMSGDTISAAALENAKSLMK